MTNRTFLVLLDTSESELRSPVLELITAARGLGRVEGVCLSAPSPAVRTQLGAYGVDTVRRVQLPAGALDAAHLPAVAGAALAAAMTAATADVALLTSTFAHKEAAARAAHLVHAALVVDATGLSESDSGALQVATRAFGGAWDVMSEPASAQAVVVMRANAVSPVPVSEPVVTDVVDVAVQLDGDVAERVVRRVVLPDAGGPALGEAAIVVAGGRGTNGDFGPVADLADALGAAVGATRDAAYEGWHDTFIGQTGVSVSPRVYIGAGISGAVHHRGGMQASQVIIAVNNDPECPLFEIADFAVIGDLADVLPQAAAVIRAHKAQP